MSAIISSSLLRFVRRSAFLNGLKCTSGGLQERRSLHVDSPPQNPSLTTSYVHGTSSISMLPLTIGQCLDRTVERWPDREALVFSQDGIRKTFAQFQEDVDKAAAGLLALGLKPGDRLGLWGPNSYEWILFQFATAKAGIIMVSLNPAYQKQEMEFTLKKVQCKAVVCSTHYKDQDLPATLKEICPEIESSTGGAIQSPRLPDLRIAIVMDSRQSGMLRVNDVMQAGESGHHRELMELQSRLSCDDPINIQFTSGTTGNPKAAVLSHHGIINSIYIAGIRLGYTRPDVRVCVPLPMYHLFGSAVGGLMMGVHGVTLVYPSSTYSSKANLESIQNERCNFLLGTPTMFIDLLGQPDLRKYDLSSLQSGIVSGAPCPPEIISKLKTDLNMTDVVPAYGITEISTFGFFGFPEDNDELKMNTVGCVMPHLEAKVVDPTSEMIVALGEPGELLIRGTGVMLGYWEDPQKTREAITESRWYKTGDIATMNSLGYCQIVGRIKDMIIRGGQNIYPAEIEQLLYTHPKVHEAQVVGVKDERLGEQVCACIRLKEGQSCSTEEIIDFCKGQISQYKTPKYVVFTDSFPMTVSGKIKKNILRQDAEKKLRL